MYYVSINVESIDVVRKYLKLSTPSKCYYYEKKIIKKVFCQKKIVFLVLNIFI